MARYIDADALKNDGHLCWHDGKGNIYSEVDHAPTADVAEVVRCKDCVKSGTFRCVKSKGERPTTTKNTEFCCWGEKRD